MNHATTLLLKILVAALTCGTILTSNASGAASRPNIIVFLVDDMGIMDTSVPFLTDSRGQPLSYPLNKFYRTPNMERLARLGIRLNNFYAMSVCSPTRISIMTGQNAARHHSTNWINPDRDNGGPHAPPDWNWQGLTRNDVTLARLLHEAGYYTVHIGKGHFGPRESEGADPLNLGFEANIGGCSIGAPGSYYAKQNFGKGSKRAANAVPHLDKYHGTDIYLTEALTIEAKAHVDLAIQARKPFFLYLPHYAVHAPFNSDPRFAHNYRDSGKTAPAQAFATMVEGMDKSLGDLLDHVEKAGVAEDTLIFFLGDNGTDAPLGHEHSVACAEPLRGKKGSHYEGGLRVPFLAAWVRPNSKKAHQRRLPIAAGAIQSQQAAVYDLFPTILSMLNLEAPPQHIVDGSPLDTLLTGQTDQSRKQEFLMHYPHSPHRSNYFTCYRRGPWKVIYHYFPSDASEQSHYQLYNLDDDPFESTNMADTQVEPLRTMMRELVASLKAHHAQYPLSAEDHSIPLEPIVP